MRHQIWLIFTAIFYDFFFFAEDETNACLMRCILTRCCKRLHSRDRSLSRATSNIDPLLWDLISSWICPAQHEYCAVPSDVELSPTAFGRRSIMNVVICYWCNWLICPITLETVVSPFLLGRSIWRPSDRGGILRRNNEPTAPTLPGEGLSLLLHPSGRGEDKNTPKCQNLETIMAIFSIKWIYIYTFFLSLKSYLFLFGLVDIWKVASFTVQLRLQSKTKNSNRSTQLNTVKKYSDRDDQRKTYRWKTGKSIEVILCQVNSNWEWAKDGSKCMTEEADLPRSI